MKTLFALLVLVAVVALGASAPSQVRADDGCYRDGGYGGTVYLHRHCNHCQAVVSYEQRWVEPVYCNRTVFVGYDGCGNPVYRNQTVCVQRGYVRTVRVVHYVCNERRARRGGFRFDFRF